MEPPERVHGSDQGSSTAAAFAGRPRDDHPAEVDRRRLRDPRSSRLRDDTGFRGSSTPRPLHGRGFLGDLADRNTDDGHSNCGILGTRFDSRNGRGWVYRTRPSCSTVSFGTEFGACAYLHIYGENRWTASPLVQNTFSTMGDRSINPTRPMNQEYLSSRG